MILKRFYNESLAQASYLVGCAKTGEAIVIDPNRHLDQYLESAAAEGLRITAVTETHIHADYLSGSRELAARTGAELYLSDEGDTDWKYGFGHEPNVRLVKDGDSIRVGNVRLDVVHTPGHTPEHISFLLTDEPASSEPMAVFTGDFVFVGDVGRPDLLERAANFRGTMEKGARTLFRSILAFRSMPGELMIWPAHGAGSACGKSLGGVPVSTVAHELRSNWALKAASEDSFVDEVLAGQPEPPVYFKEMKLRNKVGPAMAGESRAPLRLAGGELASTLDRGEIVVDTRPAGVVNAGFFPGTLNIPLDSAFVNWAGWLIPYDRPIYLYADDQDSATRAAADLRLIGLDQVAGWFGRDALRAFEAERGTLPITPMADMRRAIKLSRSSEARLLDVRGQSEWEAGNIPGAIHIPLGYLPGRTNEVPTDLPVLVHCAGGTRSAIAASILHRAGLRNVVHVPGGYYEYLEIEKGLEPISAPGG